MKKYILSIFIIVLVLGLTFGVMYAIDMNKMNNNKPIVFSTWGYDYTSPDNYENIVTDESQNKDEDFKVSGDIESFIGTVLEETTRYMIVEPNSGEMERKSSDKIMINYGVDHIDYLYGIGRKVVIRYTGGIMETYPAQINTDDISAEGYEDFELSVTKADNLEKKKILNNNDLYKNNSEFHTLDGNRDVYIGSLDMTIDEMR